MMLRNCQQDDDENSHGVAPVQVRESRPLLIEPAVARADDALRKSTTAQVIATESGCDVIQSARRPLPHHWVGNALGWTACADENVQM
jgi:hypothetical protein